MRILHHHCEGDINKIDIPAQQDIRSFKQAPKAKTKNNAAEAKLFWWPKEDMLIIYGKEDRSETATSVA